MKLRMAFVAGLLLLTSGISQAENTLTIQGTLSDNGRPFPDGLVVVQRMKDAKCAKLSFRDDLSRKEWNKLNLCGKDLEWIHTDQQGRYAYQKLAPGWYNIRFLWLMSTPPRNNTEVQCIWGDWGVQFHPEKDHSGKYNGYAEEKVFELRESKEINFDYRPEALTGTSCLRDISGPRPEPGQPNKVQVYYPGVDGVLELDPGPTAWNLEFHRETKETWMRAMRRADKLYVSAFIQKVEFTATPEACRFARWRHVEQNLREVKTKPMNVQLTSRNGMALVQAVVRSPQGEIVDYHDIHAYLGTGSICAEVHLSKEQFNSGDEKLFDAVLGTVRFVAGPESAQRR